MKIISKSESLEMNIKGKTKINKYIEIQLFNEFDDIRNNANTLFNEIIKDKNADVLVVHSPLLKEGDLNIEYIDSEKSYNYFRQTIKLAHLLSEYYNHNIIVVIHSIFNFDEFNNFPSILNKITDFFGEMLQKCPRLEFAFENVVPFIYDKKNRLFQGRNNYTFENVKLAKYFNNYFNTDRFGTVLDTCHALVSNRILTKCYRDSYEDLLIGMSLEDYFKANKDTIKLIHLATVTNLGSHPGEHGILFTQKDMELLNEIMYYYTDYEYKCNITIEITEDDYIENKNFRNNYKLLVEYCKNNNIKLD